MASLANFLRDELPRRGWSIPEWAPRARLSLSNAYLIVRDGRDNVRRDTLDGIAESLNMTAAELNAAIGKSADLAPDEAEVLSIFRQVPDDRRPAAKDMLRGLALTSSRNAAMRRNDPAAIRRKRLINQIEANGTDLPDSTPNKPLDARYGRLFKAFGFLRKDAHRHIAAGFAT